MLRWSLSLLLLISLLGVVPAFAQGADNTIEHVVQPGENLFRIALRYGVSQEDLVAVNEIVNAARITAGETLLIPGLTAPNASDTVTNPLVASAPILYTVTYGDTVQRIANIHGISVEQVLRGNDLANPDLIYPGQELQIWTDEISTTAATEPPTVNEALAEPIEIPDATTTSSTVNNGLRTTHVVQRGEHLSQIAGIYGVGWALIAEANNLTNPNSIQAGMSLTIPGVSGPPTASANAPISRAPTIADHLYPPGAHWGTGRELVVDLSTQMAYAYENGILQYSALVSTGLSATPTVQGEFAIWHKTRAQTMSGPGYSLPNVEWVMYFYAGYGFHGTYWHNNFGNPMSHGCVNMTNADAQWFYNFASVGTPVYVQY